MERIQTDVLIVGAGGAGLRAALAAKETFPQGKIVLVTKGDLGKAGVTANACSDRMAFHATLPYTEPGGDDNWRYHAEDIYRIGGYVSDGDLAVILAKHSKDAFAYLDRLGVPFVKKENGRAEQFITDGSEYARACYTGPRTAFHMEEALLKKLSSTDVLVVEHCMVTELITRRGRVVGAFGIDERAEKIEEGLKVFSSKGLILATGGAGEAFSVHVYPPGMTGDGYALSYRAGAELVNMEFIQIGLSSVETKLACSGSMMRAVPRFVNEEGREFLFDYFAPETPVAEVYSLVFEKGSSWPVSREKSTHLIDVAVWKEWVKGHRVFLDFGENPRGFSFEALPSRWQDRYRSEIKNDLGKRRRARSPLYRLEEINPASIEWLEEHGIDLRRGDRIEIAPAIQHFQGGVKIRQRAQASLEGLYAAGECAGGQHGANRPGGNALLDGQVFGRIAGEEAAKEAMVSQRNVQPSDRSVETYLRALRRKEGLKAQVAREEIRSTMARFASVVRTEEGLREGLRRLGKIRREGVLPDEMGVVFSLETENLLDVAEMVLRACLMRKESRGPHLRFSRIEDEAPLPSRDPEWRRFVVIQNEEGRMVLKKRRPVALSETLG